MKLLEAIFRRFILLLVLLVMPAILGVGVAYVLPRTYQSTASLWALKRYEIIGATGAESNLQASPADTQAEALTELLQSSSFDTAVAQSTDLKSTLGLSQHVLSNPQLLNNALVLEISKKVTAISMGYNLYEVSYTNRNPQVAEQVVSAVITEFHLQGLGFSIVEGQRLLQGYQGQLTQAENDANNAAKNESAYLAAHPDIVKSNSSPLNDPQYALLDAKRVQAETTLQSIQSTIATLNQEIATQSTGSDTFFKVLDPPIMPDVATSRTKLFLTAGGIGAAVGLLFCVLYILFLVRRDRSLYSVHDVRKATAYPVLIQIQQFSVETKALLIPAVTD